MRNLKSVFCAGDVDSHFCKFPLKQIRSTEKNDPAKAELELHHPVLSLFIVDLNDRPVPIDFLTMSIKTEMSSEECW